MESKTHDAPSFTVSLRGYDRMEVDEYLDSLAEALGQVEEAEDVNRGLRNHIERLNARIADLEQRISSDTPKTGAVLGERIAILLGSAEETASETIAQAGKEAADMLETARDQVAQAEDQARGAIVRADEQARRIEASARAEAAEIVSEAEARATARTRQIEQWAEQVVSHTRAEEARMLTEQQQKRDAAEEELRRLAERRDAVAGTITDLRAALGEALGLVGPPPMLPEANHVSLPVPELTVADVATAEDEADESDDTEVEAEADARADAGMVSDSGPMTALAGEVDPSDEIESVQVVEGAKEDASSTTPFPHTDPAQMDAPEATAVEVLDQHDDEDDVDEMPWPAAFRPFDTVDESDQTGEMRAAEDMPTNQEDFDEKFQAWVTGAEGPRHFKKL
ncbi:MAG TPA: DivIVA domain-containing protein [Acidimicrobiales bacterium]|jgi:DivIVA domain-containing protein|nr:DivIVA domain-containing protein [Acidimicrobiales bacterium]